MNPIVEVRRGSAGNIIAGLASFFFPGLGQLVQGRILSALFFFVLSCVLWLVFLGFIAHIWSAFNAALFDD
jgi:TM2 domain-containing membrane protein YozV